MCKSKDIKENNREQEIIKLAEEVFKQYDKTLKDLVKR